MLPLDIFQDRIQRLNEHPIRKGDFILYWMQQSQRAVWNHALEYAVELANHSGQPVVVVFGVTDRYPEANLRHYTFMFEGLMEARQTLARRGIRMVVRVENPPEAALEISKRASVIICDRGYLKHQRAWRQEVAAKASCPVIQVESDVVVPVEAVSEKAQYAARTIRPKIHRLLDRYLMPIEARPLRMDSLGMKFKDNVRDLGGGFVETLNIDKSVPAVSDYFHGGTSRAVAQLWGFIRKRLSSYHTNSNQPQEGDVSYMSPYLHFGQISPIYIALNINAAPSSVADAKSAYLEQLIVRRELAINFVEYTADYDSYRSLPNWARQTLKRHRKDRREYRYTQKQLEAADTHDPYWNAAMKEMVVTGFMHNYMRMYWGKKILEWSDTPEAGFNTTLALNNKYFLDGRDPNSYTGVSWIYGTHDRAWPERAIFGKVRYMAASGLERKCDIQGYVEKVEKLARER
ncbi:Deoxyribodipyrimidine photolyase, type II (EC [Olavius algarvensis associated proteobacterium Delta 3]|nr:Deoxyribodipyrimidine photolyase, type II (EC [Olavius algarvensis associated proteobacterium Delta 3]